jgi:hypothetical protein
LNGLLSKLRSRAAALTLTADQKSDFQYHMRSYACKNTVGSDADGSKLEDLGAACAAIGIKLQDLIAN